MILDMATTIVRASAEWRSFKIDPGWCMQYLSLADEFLRQHRLFTAEQPLVFIVQAGLVVPPTLRDDVWCEGFDMLLRLGWMAPWPERLHGSTQWMSLL